MLLFFRSNLHEWLRRHLGLPDVLTADITLILVTLAAAVAMGLVAIQIARIPANYRRYDPDEYDPRFNGIGGTLLITAALVTLEPVRLGIEIIVDRFLWSAEAHQLFAEMDGMGGFWIFFNAAVTGIRLTFALLLIWLFYKRRRVFRLAAISYLLLTMILFLLHDFILTQIFTANNMAVFENFSQVTRSIQLTLLLSPYLLFARRIQATLRN